MTEPAPPSPQPSPWDGDTASSPPPAVEPTAARTGWKQWAAAGVVAAVLAGGVGIAISLTGGDNADAVATQDSAAAAAGDAGTQAGFPGGRGTAGTITSIDGSTLTLEATARDSGDTSTVTVETSDETTVSESVEGSLADLEEGDNVLIMGTSADGTVTAQRIVDSGDVEATGPGAGGGTGAPPEGMGTPPEGMGTPPEGMGTPPEGMGTPTVGTIASIDGSTFVVETSDGGSVTVTASDDTTITVTKQLTMDDLATGDTITVTGTTSDATVSASSIRKGELGVGGGFGGPGGGPGMAPPEGFTPPDGSGSSTPTTTA
jgi:hypothetical protein